MGNVEKKANGGPRLHYYHLLNIYLLWGLLILRPFIKRNELWPKTLKLSLLRAV